MTRRQRLARVERARRSLPRRSARRTWLLPGLVGAAFVVRLAYVLQYRSSPFFESPIIDSATYDRMAWGYAQGEPLWKDAFWQPPLYPWLLGLFYRLVGHALLGARVVQAAMGAISCWFLYGIGKRVFGHATGVAAACIMALYGTFVFFDGEVLIPTLNVFLLLAGLLVLLQAREGRGRRGWSLWTLAGLILGLAALARPNILLFLPVAARWGFWAGGAAKSWRRALGPGVLLLAAALVISIVAVRNHRAAHDLVLISSNGGLNFYLGNNSEASKTLAVRPGFAWESLVNEPHLKYGIRRPSARSRYFFGKAGSFLREDPAAALALYGTKIARFWNSFEIGRNRDVYGTRGDSSLLSILLWRHGPFGFPFGIVAPLACAGMIICFSKEPRRVLLYLFVSSYALSVILFFVASRYRLPVVPVLIVFAARYGIWLVEQRRAGHLRSMLLTLAPLLLAVGAVNRGLPDLERIYRGETDRYLGVYHLDEGRQDEAERAYRRAIAADPGYAEAHAELAQLLQKQGRQQEALAHFLEANQICPLSEKTHYLLGTGYAASGRPAEAEARFRRAIEIAPPFALPHRELGSLLLGQGRLEEAERLLTRSVQIDPDDLDAWYKLGQCSFLRGEYRRAEGALSRALELAPGDREILDKIESLRRLRAGTSPDAGQPD